MTEDDDDDLPMTEEEYELAWPKITRRLQRLCDEFGALTVLGTLANDMPYHREERELERRARELERRAKPWGAASEARH
jgi:hypothetical protein